MSRRRDKKSKDDNSANGSGQTTQRHHAGRQAQGGGGKHNFTSYKGPNQAKGKKKGGDGGQKTQQPRSDSKGRRTTVVSGGPVISSCYSNDKNCRCPTCLIRKNNEANAKMAREAEERARDARILIRDWDEALHEERRRAQAKILANQQEVEAERRAAANRIRARMSPAKQLAQQV